MIHETDLFGNNNKVEQAIKILKTFEPEEGYVLAFSGGKDSVVIKAIADMAGVKYHAVYNNTTVDNPELVQFVRTFKDVEFLNPEKSMRQLIYENGVPTRLQRFCCKHLKERSYPGRLTITGVRWAESTNRKNNQGMANIFGDKKGENIILNDDNDENRRMVEQCYRTTKTLINPIINWSDSEVWEFIHKYNISYCCLYDEGYTRLGCLGCPMKNTNGQEDDFKRYPKYKKYYINAFQAWLEKRRRNSGEQFREGQTGEDLFNWWLYGTYKDKEYLQGEL